MNNKNQVQATSPRKSEEASSKRGPSQGSSSKSDLRTGLLQPLSANGHDTLSPFAVLDEDNSHRRISTETGKRLTSQHLPPVYLCGETPWRDLMVDSASTAQLLERVMRITSSDTTILIVGPDGTGKKLFARLLHALSEHHDRPLVYFNGARIPALQNERLLFGDATCPGYLEAANGGTLLIENVELLSLSSQRKLLRLLRDGTFSRDGEETLRRSTARILASTSRSLSQRTRRQLFLPDLHFHLRVLRLTLPPLRSRDAAAIERLARFFLARSVKLLKRADLTFSKEALELLSMYPWPGNVGELEQAIQASALIADEVITPASLPHHIRSHPSVALGQPQESSRGAQALTAAKGHPFEDEPTLEELNARYIAYLLKHHTGNRSACARVLDIGRNTLLTKMRHHKLS